MNVALNPDLSNPMSLNISWEYSDWVIATRSIVQVALDSNFTSGIIVDTLLPTNDAVKNTTLLIQNMEPTTKYYWRTALKFLDGTNTPWSSISRFTTAGGIIRGTVFNDLNRNGFHDTDEPGLPRWTLNVAGKISATIRTDDVGDYVISGIDSGTYLIMDNVLTLWKRSYPDTNFYVITLDRDDTLSGYKFGRYFPWNSISGMLFHDLNENGVKDTDEQGLADWLVRIEGYSESDTTLTNSFGYYCFNKISLGSYTVTPIVKQSWEQIYPIYQQGYPFTFDRYDNHHSDADFSLHPIPQRVKIVLRVHDNRRNPIQSVRWGVRSGASYGIWGVDPQSSIIDFSEGEFEIPPRLPNSFDVRFEDPHQTYKVFGLGSWTDMRAFYSQSQIDTFQVRFYPGVNSGGGYPITFFWSKESVIAAYSSAVLIGDSNELSVDMTQNDSLIVTNPNINFLKIIADSPILPPTDVRIKDEIIPEYFYLEQNFPNPFNPITDIRYQIADVSFVNLKVYNILGQEIATLVNTVKQPGKYIVRWNASTLDGELPSGIYFYRMICGDYSSTKKFLFLK
ncbi:MAG: SdrD B-like domain-containing protein [Bacteroidota bacterium]|nr:SdrD B-like domain-containing protein [Bacteroidota bacterium]